MDHKFNPNHRYNIYRMIEDARRRADHDNRNTVIHLHSAQTDCDFDPHLMEDTEHITVNSHGDVHQLEA